MTNQLLDTFSELSKLPTTSFYEQKILEYIKTKLTSYKIEFHQDPWGNIVAEVNGKTPNEIVFISHTDHPGFEIIAKHKKNIYLAKALGGLPKNCITNQTNVKIISNRTDLFQGKIINFYSKDNTKINVPNDYRWMTSEFVLIESDSEKINLPSFAVFDLPETKFSGERIITPVADDLAGCALIIETLNKLNKSSNEYSFKGIFSRAEEVGLIGARLIAANELINKNSIIVSIETSSELPGANFGKGPIIRTGDRITTFDNKAELVLLQSVKEILQKDIKFAYQRQLMSAGGCEASAFAIFGYSVTGLALPLRNWHNGNEEGDVEPEEISLLDFENAYKIMTNLGKLDIVEMKDYFKNLVMIPEDAKKVLNEE